MVDVIIENGELFGKERAKLRNAHITILIGGWEKQRDALLDEISFRKGQVELLEDLIKQSYEKVLDVNKEEQKKENDRIDARMQELKDEEEAVVEKQRQKEARARHRKKEAAAQKKMEAAQKRGTKDTPAPKHPTDKAADTQKRMRQKAK